MKDIDECNYYDLLDVSEDAPKNAIKEAYHASRALFDEDSTISYNFFSDQERDNLLKRLHEAFDTLTNDQKRITYDKKIFHRIGKWYQPSAEKNLLPDHRGVKSNGIDHKRTINLGDFLNDDGLVSLSKLREAAQITPEEISRATKIRVPMILALEARDFHRLPPAIYIKGHLKSYAIMLGIKPDELVEAYGPLTRGTTKGNRPH